MNHIKWMVLLYKNLNSKRHMVTLPLHLLSEVDRVCCGLYRIFVQNDNRHSSNWRARNQKLGPVNSGINKHKYRSSGNRLGRGKYGSHGNV